MRTLSLAARNLTRNLRRTALTAAAIAFGLAMMLTNISLATGQYRAMLKGGISALAGHVVVEHPLYGDEAETDQLVRNASARTEKIRAIAGDAVVSPRIQLGGLMNSPTNSVGVGLRGIVPSAEGEVLSLPDKLSEGEWLADDDDRGAILGALLAEQLGVEIGDKVVFMGQGVDGEVESRLFRVRGMFRTGSSEQDGSMAYATVAAVQELVGVPDAVHQIAVHLTDPDRTDDVLTAARSVLTSDDIVIKPWQEAIPAIVAMIQTDRMSNDFLLAIIGFIVAMGVLNTVLMSVLERTREFGVLLAIGMRPRQIAALVLTEGFLMGLLGTALGIVGGCLFSWPLIHYGLDFRGMMGETMTTGGVVISTLIKGAWDPARMAQYCAMSVVFTTLSASYPAWHISRLTPVDAMNRG